MGEDDRLDGERTDRTAGDAEGEAGDAGLDRPATVQPGRTDRLLHDTEHALEWMHRARGHLLAFHHAVGRAMDKLAATESGFREAGHDDLADRIRDDLLPAGVTRRDAWSFEVVEGFEAGPLASVETFETTVRERVADGERHVVERAQQEQWRERATESREE